ncbi:MULTISPECIES: DUF3631 domain-containing protein [Streptomyces]|nr:MULTISPECIES: DUF3631 domain-containing protein [Streptomyces]MCM9079351.1 DUF3631 domain-containing protein [Streptomyces spororaveus]MCX5306232.1 DUF3631 domain-containing protein [Streptomyces sp. NBC_00160]
MPPYRQRIHEKEGHALRERLAAWADSVRERLIDAWPVLPEGVVDQLAGV